MSQTDVDLTSWLLRVGFLQRSNWLVLWALNPESVRLNKVVERSDIVSEDCDEDGIWLEALVGT